MNLIVIGLLVLAIVMMSGCIKSETTAPTPSSTIEQPSEKAASSPTPKIEEQEGEKFIAKIDLSSWNPDSFKVSPDNRRLVYAAKEGGKWFLVVDDKEEKQYDSIGINIAFSPDSKRIAYVALEGAKMFVVVDGKEEKQYDNIMANTTSVTSTFKSRIKSG